MKTHFIIAGCLELLMWSITTQAQNSDWAKQLGGQSADYGYSIAVDGSGNVYTTGIFKDTADFDPGPGVHTLVSNGSFNVFICKLDAAGSFVWAKQFGAVQSSAIAVDAGNVYLTAGFGGTVDFDPGPGIYNLTSAGSSRCIIKLDNSGNLIWAKQFHGILTGISFFSIGSGAITVDPSGNVYVTGGFLGTVDFDPDTGTLHFASYSISANEGYIVKLNNAGSLVWAKQLEGIISGGDAIPHSIAIGDSGNIYVSGRFLGTYIDFDPGPGTFYLNSAGSGDVFVLKLDAAGNFAWAARFGSTANDWTSSVTVDDFGNVYCTGQFQGTVDFDPGPGTFFLTEAGNGDAFIIKLNNSGSLIWAKQLSGPSSESGNSMAIDPSGKVYVTGEFQGTTDFDPGSGIFNLTTIGNDVYIAQFTPSGDFIWAEQVGRSEVISLCLDSLENVHITGWFSGTIDFDPGSGVYNLTSAGNYDVFILKLKQSPPFKVQGSVLWDADNNCTVDTSDISLLDVLIKAEPGPFYGISDVEGNYVIYLFDTGAYTISVVTPDTFWKPFCATSYNVQVVTIPDTAGGIDFAMRATYHCPRLTVELGTPLLRRCFNNIYTVRYANTGSLPVSNAYIEVDFGKYLHPQSSTFPWSTVSGNIYTFPIGNINVSQQGSFYVTALLDCNAQLGSTQCVTAHIYPDSVCAIPSTGWDKSETKVTGACINDSLVCFKIKNRSSPPSGNMQGTAPWRLFVNDTLVTQGSYQLAGQDSLIQCYPANGKTFRLEADQRLGHPGNSHPQGIVEACGSPSNFGFVNTVAQDDEDLFVETFCMTVIGSYDPNDKQVFPTGITDNKFIKPEDELEYLIRFQNTGNDTAFKVVIRDTIRTDVIDIATLTSGASSHDYTFNIYGHGIAEWTFNNILLPDSNVNEPESHGFVKFKAKLLPNIAPGTIVTNSADIYFDFNAPVITNEVWNTVYDTVLRAPVIISGTVLTEINTPVAGVTVKLAGSATDSIVTTADGRYGFEVEPGGSYTITPSKNNDAVPSKGLTTFDILTMRRHLLGIGALPSPYKIIAASEVNAAADTSVTTQDIVLIRSLILANITSFPGNRLWQFVSSDYLFSDTQHPFPFNKTRTYTNIISNQTNQNFIGIKLGDVNESWDGN